MGSGGKNRDTSRVDTDVKCPIVAVCRTVAEDAIHGLSFLLFQRPTLDVLMFQGRSRILA